MVLDLPEEMTAEHDRELLEMLAETYLAAREERRILEDLDPPFAYEDDLRQVEDVANEIGLDGGERADWLRARQEAAAATVEFDRELIKTFAEELVARRYLSRSEIEEWLASQ